MVLLRAAPGPGEQRAMAAFTTSLCLTISVPRIRSRTHLQRFTAVMIFLLALACMQQNEHQAILKRACSAKHRNARDMNCGKLNW